MVKRLVEHPRGDEASGLRTVTYGGGPMYVADLKRALDRFGPKFVQIYGQGEAPMTITVLPRESHVDDRDPRYEARLGSVGFAPSVVEARVVDPDDNPLPAGEVGDRGARGDVEGEGDWEGTDDNANTT